VIRSPTEHDPFDVRQVRAAAGLLREFNQAGVLASADVHVATRLCELAGESDEAVKLAVALAVRAPRLGHVLADLHRIRDTATVDAEAPVELPALPWPEPAPWRAQVAASPLVATGDGTTPAGRSAASGRETVPARPLRLVGSWLYLDRLWAEEREVAAALERMGAQPVHEVDDGVLAAGLARLFAGEPPDSRQRLAAATAVLRRLSVIAGGPGTGKTTTVARVAALLCEQAAARGARPPLMALAAPTGKAAARLAEAVAEETAQMEIPDAVRQTLLAQGSSTLHRLLGRRPGSHSRFRHDRLQRLPHDVVIVDETSMVALSLMARLIEALRPQARLVLVGDPGQLASVEAGAVLGDIVGPAAAGLLMRPAARERLEVLTEAPLKAPLEVAAPPGRAPIADGIVVLDRGHRFGGVIAALAEAVRRGDGEAAVALLGERTEEVQWIPEDPGLADSAAALSAVRVPALAAATAVTTAAREGLAHEALQALGAFRILCAHRQGPHGVSSWTARVEGWLADALPGLDPADPWYPGRPLLVGENDPELGLFNGDTGVIVRSGPDSLIAAFARADGVVELHPARLSATDTVYAMTIHKSQGSQFEQVAVLLPPPDSRILTRELLLTALTRARRRLIVLGSEESVRQAVARPVARASGLRWRLWEEPPGPAEAPPGPAPIAPPPVSPAHATGTQGKS